MNDAYVKAGLGKLAKSCIDIGQHDDANTAFALLTKTRSLALRPAINEAYGSNDVINGDPVIVALNESKIEHNIPKAATWGHLTAIQQNTFHRYFISVKRASAFK
jgi:hypothetical protein